jgi:hypothetical protein
MLLPSPGLLAQMTLDAGSARQFSLGRWIGWLMVILGADSLSCLLQIGRPATSQVSWVTRIVSFASRQAPAAFVGNGETLIDIG